MKQNRVLTYVLGTLAVLAVLALVIFTASKVLEFRSSTQKLEQSPEQTQPEKIRPQLDDSSSYVLDGVQYTLKKRVETYLLMGIDRTQQQQERSIIGQADVLLLIVLDPESQTFQILQLNRDTISQVTILTADDQVGDVMFRPICLAQGYGSSEEACCENTVRSVRYLLSDVEIDGYFSVNLDAIEEINASVGGVTVKIEDDMTSVDPSFKKGATVTLTQKNAEGFVRARMNLGEEDNLGRMRRQRAFMNGWLEKAQRLARENAGFLLQFLEDIKSFSVTDMSDKKLSGIASSMEKYENRGIVTIDGEYHMGTMYNEFYLDSDSVREVLQTLYYTAQTIE